MAIECAFTRTWVSGPFGPDMISARPLLAEISLSPHRRLKNKLSLVFQILNSINLLWALLEQVRVAALLVFTFKRTHKGYVMIPEKVFLREDHVIFSSVNYPVLCPAPCYH